MTVFWVIVCIVFFITLFVSPVTFELNWVHINKQDELQIRFVALYGLVKIHKKIEVFDFLNVKDGIQVGRKRVDAQTIKKWVSYWKELLTHTYGLMRWLNAFARRISCQQWQWRNQIGMENAAFTAYSVGVLSVIVHMLSAYVFKKCQLKTDPAIQVLPIFNRTYFSSQFDCMFQIRLGHAIYAFIELAIRILKIKGGFQQWRSILFKA